MDQVLVDEVVVRYLVAGRNQRGPIVALEPLLAIISPLLVEGKIDGLVRVVRVVEADSIHLAEVVLRLITS